jgi:hypothetical protein
MKADFLVCSCAQAGFSRFTPNVAIRIHPLLDVLSFRFRTSLFAPLKLPWQGVTLTHGSTSSVEGVRTFLQAHNLLNARQPPSLLWQIYYPIYYSGVKIRCVNSHSNRNLVCRLIATPFHADILGECHIHTLERRTGRALRECFEPVTH